MAWLEAHWPGVFPLCEGGKVRLERGLVLVVLNSSVEKAVLSPAKSMALERRTASGGSFSYVGQKEKRG